MVSIIIQSSVVEVASVESLVVEAGARNTLLLKLTPRKTGILNILGLEYSLKALFADREPTDHQIRGKQYFQARSSPYTKFYGFFLEVKLSYKPSCPCVGHDKDCLRNPPLPINFLIILENQFLSNLPSPEERKME